MPWEKKEKKTRGAKYWVFVVLRAGRCRFRASSEAKLARQAVPEHHQHHQHHQEHHHHQHHQQHRYRVCALTFLRCYGPLLMFMQAESSSSERPNCITNINNTLITRTKSPWVAVNHRRTRLLTFPAFRSGRWGGFCFFSFVFLSILPSHLIWLFLGVVECIGSLLQIWGASLKVGLWVGV